MNNKYERVFLKVNCSSLAYTVEPSKTFIFFYLVENSDNKIVEIFILIKRWVEYYSIE
jgi:hypothetical protein